jgi:hypothetical protein
MSRENTITVGFEITRCIRCEGTNFDLSRYSKETADKIRSRFPWNPLEVRQPVQTEDTDMMIFHCPFSAYYGGKGFLRIVGTCIDGSFYLPVPLISGVVEGKPEERIITPELPSVITKENLLSYFSQMQDESGNIKTTAEVLADIGMLIVHETQAHHA